MGQSRLVLVLAAVAAVVGLRSARGEAQLLTHAGEGRSTVWALSLSADDLGLTADTEPRAIDLGVIFDDTAQPSGPAARERRSVLAHLLDRLTGGSRVQVWVAGDRGRSLLSQPAAVGSAAIGESMAALAERPPGGANDLAGTISSLASWLEDRSGDLPKRVLILGTAESRLSRFDLAMVRTLTPRFLSAGCPVLWHPDVPTSPQQPLATLASLTGGLVLNADTAQEDAVRSIARELIAPVLYVDRCVTDPATTELLPASVPPLRFGRTTLIAGMGPAASTWRFTIQGRVDAKPTEATLSFAANSDDPNGFLRFLVDRWSATPEMPASGTAEEVLAQARSFADECVDGWRVQAAAARVDGRSADEKEFTRLIHEIDPTFVPTADSSDAPASTSADADLLKAARERQQIIKQQQRQQVEQSVREARKAGPESAGVILKRTLESLEAADLDEQSKGSLRQRLERELRENAREHRRVEADALQRDRAWATSEARRRQERAEQTAQAIRQQLVREVNTLLEAGHYDEAVDVADAAAQRPNSGVAESASLLRATLSRRYALIEEIEIAKDARWWDTLASTELSSAPIPDNQEIIFPSAKRWEELTARREKYKAIDLSPKSPSEEKIRKQLTKPISFDFRDTPLGEVLEFIREFAGINLIIDDRGLDEAGVDIDEPITLTLTDIPLRSALNLLLRPLDLAYLIENDVLLITSREQAETRLELKVYPVADLVIPIANFNNGGVGSSGTLGQQQGTGTGNPGAAPGGLGNAPGNLRSIIEIIRDAPRAERIKQWDEHFASASNSDAELRAAARLLMGEDRVEDLVEMLRTAEAHQPIGPWALDILATALPIVGAGDEEVVREHLSLVDRGPNDHETRQRVAARLDRLGYGREALDLLRSGITTLGPSVNAYLLMLEIAGRIDDVETATWALAQICGREWPVEGDKVSERARTTAEAVAERWRRDGRPEEAERLARLAGQAGPRDLEITARWEGEADVDLSVVEPTRLLCSALVPQTIGGGVLAQVDNAGSERYVAASAISGTYEVRLKPVWGKPTAGIVNVDIVWHKGTDQERRERRTISLSGHEESFEIELADGRRPTCEPIIPDPFLTGDAPGLTYAQARARLRQMVGTGDAGERPAGFGFGGATLSINRTVPFVTGVEGAVAGGAVAFDPVVTPIPDGASLYAQAVVSADRRFVRLQLVPLLQNIKSIDDVRTIEVGGAVGGGGVAPAP